MMAVKSEKQKLKPILEEWAIEAMSELAGRQKDLVVQAPASVVSKLVFCNHFVEILTMGLFWEYDYLLRWAASESEVIQTNHPDKLWRVLPKAKVKAQPNSWQDPRLNQY